MAQHCSISKEKIPGIVEKLENNPDLIKFLVEKCDWDETEISGIKIKKLPQEYAFENEKLIPVSAFNFNLSDYVKDDEWLEEPYLNSGSLEIHFNLDFTINKIYIVL